MASAEQTGRRHPALWQPACPLPGFLLVEVGEYLPNHRRVFDAGNDLDGATAFTTGLDQLNPQSNSGLSLVPLTG